MNRDFLAPPAIFLLAACSSEPTPIQNTVTCTQGDVIVEEHNPPPDPPAVDGGAPAETKYLFCYSWPPYEGIGLACDSVDDCPASPSPCEIVQCKSDGKCSIAWWGEGSPVCGDPLLTCLGSYCCGEDGDPN